MTEFRLLGDLRERSDGGYDGWCWAPSQPATRQVVELLVDDVPAVSIVAAIFRRDLANSGYGDGRHGFAMRLPPHLSALGGEHIVTARERRSGTVFGQVLRLRPDDAPPGGTALDQAELSVQALWQAAAHARAAGPVAPPAEAWRATFRALGAHLALRADAPARAEDGLRTPRLSILLPPDSEAGTQRRARALAPALDAVAGDMLVAPEWRHARPGRTPRGAHLLLLGRSPATPSAAGLLALAYAVAQAPAALWLGAALCAALADLGVPVRQPVHLPGRLGVVLCLPRAVLDRLGPADAQLADGLGLEWADLALKAHLLGIELRGLSEPLPADSAAEPAPMPDPATLHRAHAAFADRWGSAVNNT